jgi:DNA-binding NtrC family response regulator
VLVVDDEASVRKLAKKALERDGFRVLLAENGRVAIEQYRLRRLEIQLVLLDLTMPEMDGEQTFRALREIDPAANVVITSGYDEESMNRGSFTKETAGFLPKPYTAKQLVKCARDAII